jgi:hypothetical protein
MTGGGPESHRSMLRHRLPARRAEAFRRSLLSDLHGQTANTRIRPNRPQMCTRGPLASSGASFWGRSRNDPVTATLTRLFHGGSDPARGGGPSLNGLSVHICEEPEGGGRKVIGQ